MNDEKLKKIKKYLELRKIDEEDNSIEIIKEMNEKAANNTNGANNNE